ncbi:MAG: cytidylate kinase-like family protein [Deltaproteobacteria bacterium]|nr:cytidylate kinase-like family protein [Deltaproteobacteria bacterium]
MQIICISRGTFTGGKNLAENLAKELGYECLSREDLTESATRAGIPVGKLEMAVMRHRPLNERLAIEKERYKAFVTATLCEKALEGGLVYHGRTGHLVLPGVSHVFRIRAIMDPEQRVASVMERLNLKREKAREYIEHVDDDRRRWIRNVYNVDWEDPALYDIVVSLSHMRAENAAISLVATAQLPEFQVTPATRKALENLLLAARCRLAIGADQRTRDMSVQVKAERGTVSVTYLPRQYEQADLIPKVLGGISEVKEVICTMASTNILWLQEKFDPNSPQLDQLLEIAAKWNAAIEMVALPEETETPDESVNEIQPDNAAGNKAIVENGGILDDKSDPYDFLQLDEGFQKTRSRLITAGRAGGCRIVHGGMEKIIETMDRAINYDLVVVGNVYLKKEPAVRKRLTAELVSSMYDTLRSPVLNADDLKAHYLFGPRQWFKFLSFGVLAIVLFLLVLKHQSEVLSFLTDGDSTHMVLSTAVLVAFVPLFAFGYGNFTEYLLRLFKFE